jgi:hypothetical protein
MRLLFICCVLCIACGVESVDPSQEIIDKSIDAHGGDRFERLKMKFELRDRTYTIERMGEQYAYTRSYMDTLYNHIYDSLSNEGFKRFTNRKMTALRTKEYNAFKNGLNSVAYFALLPYRLNDSAVRKTYLGETNLLNNPYHVVQITFGEEGGGQDHDDVYLYWIHAETYFLDFLAYSFQENEGGFRFRQAFNRRNINGIYVQDYYNFKPTSNDILLEDLETLFLNEKLEKVSDIRLNNVEIRVSDHLN